MENTEKKCRKIGNHFFNITKHPAQKFVNRMWKKIEHDCYFSMNDMPAVYNQLDNIVILDMDNTHNSPLNYMRNRVFYSDYLWKKKIQNSLTKQMKTQQEIESAKKIAAQIKEINLKK